MIYRLISIVETFDIDGNMRPVLAWTVRRAVDTFSQDNFHLVRMEVTSCRSHNLRPVRHESYPLLTSPAYTVMPLIAAPLRGSCVLPARIPASSTSQGMACRPVKLIGSFSNRASSLH